MRIRQTQILIVETPEATFIACQVKEMELTFAQALDLAIQGQSQLEFIVPEEIFQPS